MLTVSIWNQITTEFFGHCLRIVGDFERRQGAGDRRVGFGSDDTW
jgi:hypothetical protein